MTDDCQFIVPSRGRPEQLGYMLGEALRLSEARINICVCLDSDDTTPGYFEVARKFSTDPRVSWYRGERQSLAGWTNFMARRMLAHYYALGSLGDDHVPMTRAWDLRLITALRQMGGGFAYPNDLHQGRNLPTAVVVSSGVAAALGWFACPAMNHYYIDQVWKDLGLDTGHLAYLEDVIVEHKHPIWGGAPDDATYRHSYMTFWQSDTLAYDTWCKGQRALDADTVRKALSGAAPG